MTKLFAISKIIVICFVSVSLASEPVDILPSGLGANIKEDGILRVYAQNKTNSKNLTFVKFIDEVRTYNDTVRRFSKHPVDQPSVDHYYDVFPAEIDNQVNKLTQLIPVFDVGKGPVSAACRKQAQNYQSELKRFSLWALKMFDATAKIPSGILSGNINQLGDFDECVNIDGQHGIQGQYCLAYMQIDVSSMRPDLQALHRLVHSHYAFRNNMSDPGHRVPRFGTISWALCVPSACTPQDVQASLKHVLDEHTEKTGIKIQVKVDSEMCQVRKKGSYPTETVVVGIFFLSVILLALIAGLNDHYGLSMHPLVSSFSIKKNVSKLTSLERNDGDIAILHGIRALNAFMLLLSHKSLALFFNPYTNRTQVAELIGKPWTVIGRAASLYTDPFIMLSGLLTTYSFVGKLEKSRNLDIRNEYLSRLFRIVPTLGSLILFCTYVMPFTGSGPQWNLVVTQHADICKKTWWRSFLFIHNYFGFENMCLTHTHHLGIDTQLFVVSPLMILLLYKKPKLGAMVLAAIAIFSTALRYYVTLYKHLNNYVFFGTSIRILFDTANLSYILPTHRLTVYILGITTGYVLRKWPKNHSLDKRLVHLGWFISASLGIGAIFGPAPMGSISYVYNPYHAAMYNAFAPIGWCVFFIWVTFLVHTGDTDGWLSKFLSWRGFIITTRLSYAVYLTQFPVFFYNVGQTRSAEHIGFVTSLINPKEWIWIAMASIVLTVLFDMPFQNIKNHYFKKRPGTIQAQKKTQQIKAD